MSPQQQKPQLPIRQIVVTRCDLKRSGKRDDGQEWQLFTVVATTPQGEAIGAKLVAFEELPLGEPIQVTVKEKNDPQWGISYTLAKVKPSPSRRCDDLEKAVRDLYIRVGQLEGR